MESWYMVEHMREYVHDCERLQFPSSLDRWVKGLADASDAHIRVKFGRIQSTIVEIIYGDILHRDGVFHPGNRGPPPNRDIEIRVVSQGDHRPFMSLEGALPFPPKPKPAKK